MLQKIRQFPRYLKRKLRAEWKAIQLEGKIVGTENKLTILYCGDKGLLGSLKLVFFPSGCQINELGAIKPFAKKINMFIHPGIDIVLQEIPPWRCTEKHLMPPYIEAVINLPALPNVMEHFLKGFSRNMRNYIQRAKKAGFEVEQSNRLKDYRFFLNELLIPMIETRHGENAICPTLEELSARRRRETILFLKKDGIRQVGALITWPRFSKGQARFTRVGFRKEIFEDLKVYKIFNTAAYYYTIDEVIKRGCCSINFGVTPPVTTNGIYINKSRWGASFTLSNDLTRWTVDFLNERKDLILSNLPVVFLERDHLKIPAKKVASEEKDN